MSGEELGLWLPQREGASYIKEEGENEAATERRAESSKKRPLVLLKLQVPVS